MPRPEILLTEVWLGTRKKYTAAAMIATAAVRIRISFRISVRFDFFFPSLSLQISVRYAKYSTGNADRKENMYAAVERHGEESFLDKVRVQFQCLKLRIGHPGQLV